MGEPSAKRLKFKECIEETIAQQPVTVRAPPKFPERRRQPPSIFLQTLDECYARYTDERVIEAIHWVLDPMTMGFAVGYEEYPEVPELDAVVFFLKWMLQEFTLVEGSPIGIAELAAMYHGLGAGEAQKKLHAEDPVRYPDPFKVITKDYPAGGGDSLKIQDVTEQKDDDMDLL